ncbi:hypothetical protein TNIN_154521 [Trichonephila inaurata madagascariensis]|uniref:Uncharacterized protein n=1 Tax=Trichonephila inaurata madagascariensis TaxID=2747483 RepID=A0A8X6YLE3_9ARAC|nr:hypothetical protein TNIN_154521 [Trichonephila inaurata madagascariensis]
MSPDSCGFSHPYFPPFSVEMLGGLSNCNIYLSILKCGVWRNLEFSRWLESRAVGEVECEACEKESEKSLMGFSSFFITNFLLFIFFSPSFPLSVSLNYEFQESSSSSIGDFYESG